SLTSNRTSPHRWVGVEQQVLYLRYEGVVDGSCKLMASCRRGRAVQRATASTTSVHRPPDQDRRACLLAFPWAQVRARGPDAQWLTSMARWRWSAPAAP